MIRFSSRPVIHALLGMLIVAGCSATVQPIRPKASVDPARKNAPKATVVVDTNGPITELPVASCPEEAPPPVLDSSAKFILQNGHERGILRIALSADGRTLASAGLDGTVRIWDVRAGILLRKFGTAGFFVSGLSLSADGKRLAYYAPDGSPEGLAIRIVDLDRPDPPRTLTPMYGSFSLSHDGKKLAIAVDKLAIFDVENRKQLLDLPLGMKSPMALDVAFDETQGRIAVTAAGEVVIVDVEKGTIINRLTTNNSTLADVPLQVLFSQDHVYVRAGSGVVTQYALAANKPPVTLPNKYKHIAIAGHRLWGCDPTTGEITTFSLPNLTAISLPASNPVRAELISASADESTVVFAARRYDPNTRYLSTHMDMGTIMDARDGETMRPLRTIEGRETGIDAIAINPAADELVTGSMLGELGRWNLRTGARAVPLPDQERDRGRTLTMDYAPHGQFFVSTNGGTLLRVRDSKTGLTVRSWTVQSTHDVRYAGFLPQKTDLITVSQKITRELSKTKKLPNGMPVVDETFDVLVDKWDLSGPTPAIEPQKSGVRSPPTGKPVGHATNEATSAVMSPSGNKIALLGASSITMMNLDKGVVSWVAPLQTLALGSPKQADGVLDHQARWATFSPDGKSLVLSTRRLETNAQKVQVYVPVLIVFDTATGRVTATHHLDAHGPVAWRKDTLFIGGVRPGLFDAPKMKLRSRIAALDNRITAVTLHPKRDLFVMGGDGGATSFVDENGGVTATLVATPNGEWIAATPDGSYQSSIDGARSIAWSFSSPLEGFSFERFAARYDKPDVVGRRLLGESSPGDVSLARPPRLKIEAASRGVVRTNERTIALQTLASSASRVDRVRAFVDGRPVAEQLVCAREGHATLDVPLHGGQNRVALVAYDAAGQASNTQDLDVISTSRSADKPNLYVVAIGVSRYPNMPEEQQLDFADDDATAIAEAFRRHAGPNKPFAKIFTSVFLDEKVTVKSVENAVDSLRVMGPDDLAVVFFAGHGAKLSEGKMVFMTHQAAFNREAAEKHGVGWDKIQRSLSGVRGRVLMMLDACHSGYLTTEIVAPNEDLARQLAAGDRAGVFIFSAARGSQFSFEVPVNQNSSTGRGLELAWNDGQKPPPKAVELAGGHGLFTSALLEALDGNAPDRDRSGATEVGELVDYVTERVRSASNGKQTPWVARREMFGEFFVVPAK